MRSSSTFRQLAGACIALGALAVMARAQTFHYQAEPRAGEMGYVYAESDPPPRMAYSPDQFAAEVNVPVDFPPRFDEQPVIPRGYGRYQSVSARHPVPQNHAIPSFRHRIARAAASEPIPPGELNPFPEDITPDVQVPDEGVYYEGYQDAGYPPGEPPLEPEVMGEPFLQGQPGAAGQCCPTCGGCDAGCQRCYMKKCWSDVRCAASNGAYSENFSLFTGKQGFKGPVDLGVNGDFGFHGGGTWGMPLIDRWGIGYQIGANYLASDFAGRTGPLGHRRTQFFVTSGLYHRVSGDRGFQGGAVFDYLRDDFYIQMDLGQVRAEASYFLCGHELGFWGAFMTNTTTHVGSTTFETDVTYSYQANNQYNAFYRYEFCNGTYCRSWIGMSGHGDGIFGSDATVRISEKLGLIATYNYLLPRNDPGVPNNVKESWNLTISLVWYPCYKRCDSWTNCYRPLFYTADNGWFLVRQAN